MSNIDYNLLTNPTKLKELRNYSNSEAHKFIFAKNIIEFIESPEYIGEELFPKQKEILEKYYLTTDENNVRLYQELVVISGMRSGKTKLAAWIGLYELHKLLEILESGETLAAYYKKKGVSVGLGQRIYFIIVAAALDQAESTVFSQLKGMMDESKFFKRYIKYLKQNKQFSQDKYEIRFKNTIHIKAEDSNSQTLVGKTIHTLMFDEISRLDTSDGEIAKKSQKKTAQMVYQGLSKGTTTFREDRNIIVVSAPVYEDDFGMQMLLQSGSLNPCDETSDVIGTMSRKYPNKVISRLGYHSTSFDFNPTLDKDKDPLVLGTKISSPLTYKRDYLALPPVGIDTYFEDPSKIDSCVGFYEKPLMKEFNYYFDEKSIDGMGNTMTRTYVGKTPKDIESNNLIKYIVCCDQAAKKDSFAICIGHGEWVQSTDVSSGAVRKKLKTVIDYITRWTPDKDKGITVNFENVIQFLNEVKQKMNIQYVTFDQWSSESFLQRMHTLGIQSKEIPITISMWENLRSKVNEGLISFPQQEICESTPDLLQELKKLQLVKGKEVNHTATSTKDLSDAVARVNYLVDESMGGFNNYAVDNYNPQNLQAGNLEDIVRRHVLPLIEHKNQNSGAPANINLIFTGVSL